MVVQQNNYREMPAFVELGRRFNADIIYFSRLSDWGSFTEGELKWRQIHDKRHIEFNEFVQTLRKPILQDKDIELGNLKEFAH